MAGDSIKVSYRAETERTSQTINYLIFELTVNDPTKTILTEKLQMIKDSCSTVFSDVEA